MAAELVYYQEDPKNVPMVEWLEELPAKALQKCLARLELLEQHGHELRRPEADYPRDGIYELRASYQEYTTGCFTSFINRRLWWSPTV